MKRFVSLGISSGSSRSLNDIVTCIQTEVGDSPNSIGVVPNGGSLHRLFLEPEVELIGAADVDIKTLADCCYLLVMPELTEYDSTPWDNEATVIFLWPGKQ